MVKMKYMVTEDQVNQAALNFESALKKQFKNAETYITKVNLDATWGTDNGNSIDMNDKNQLKIYKSAKKNFDRIVAVSYFVGKGSINNFILARKRGSNSWIMKSNATMHSINKFTDSMTTFVLVLSLASGPVAILTAGTLKLVTNALNKATLVPGEKLFDKELKRVN
ncbi:hypothetical protein ACPBEI_00390 [Latilactobacillus sakei]